MDTYESLASKLTDIKDGVSFIFWRKGRLAYIKATGDSVVIAKGWNVIAKIPSGYRPPMHVYGFGMVETLGNMCETSVVSTGEVRIYSSRATTGFVRLALVFPIAAS